MTRLRIPLATYRLQLNKEFTFEGARAIVGYLRDLGISDLYSSPIQKARPGSMHGYDVVDAAELNPELGSDGDFQKLHEELQTSGMGLLLDIVPNHMAASPDNVWWMSLLENGPQSRYINYFDIDWSPVTGHGKLENKVLLPLLGKPYGEVLESQEIAVHFDVDGFFFTYFGRRFPAATRSYPAILNLCVGRLAVDDPAKLELDELLQPNEPAVANSKFLKETLWRLYGQPHFHEVLDAVLVEVNGRKGSPESFNVLDELLDQQFYRLAYWRVASEEINYRRFYDVTYLVGVRVEEPEVFEARTRRILDLASEGKVTGIRIDHIDGLFDPLAHLRKLQLRLADPADLPNEALPFYVVVEKILSVKEELDPEFPVSGTTGYEFIDAANTLFIHPEGLRELTTLYRQFTGLTQRFPEICYERKKQIIHELFEGEMRSLAGHLSRIAGSDRNARDFSPAELLNGLIEVTASLTVYRTYIRSAEVRESDRQVIEEAVAAARRRSGARLDPRVVEFIRRLLLLDPLPYATASVDVWLPFLMRWQQFTGRVMAKAVEDTAFYDFNRLLSMNEVGGDPGRSSTEDAVEHFHDVTGRKSVRWPHTLNASSTHDTKRSEDVRARIDVLSEMSGTWQKSLHRMSRLAAPLKSVEGEDTAPDPNEELLIYQTILGMWPMQRKEEAGVPERLAAYLEKALREAKTHTSWIAPNVDYEKRVLHFASAIFSDDGELVRRQLLRLQKKMAFYGYLNSLSQLVLKIMSPGVPDFYQGCELWNFSLVDPDNRRPVDYRLRRKLLRDLQQEGEASSVENLLRRWSDGRVKLFTTWKSLAVRREQAKLFTSGDYAPLFAAGLVPTGVEGVRAEASRHVVAFARSFDGRRVIVAVPRLMVAVVDAGVQPIGDVWGDAVLEAGSDSAPVYVNAFTGESIAATGGEIRLRDLFARFPVAVAIAR
jgi:(1->4)-alpha-D-glucan 1-alpha-D-glucosylmutase